MHREQVPGRAPGRQRSTESSSAQQSGPGKRTLTEDLAVPYREAHAATGDGPAVSGTAAPASAPHPVLPGGGTRATLQMLFDVQHVATSAPAEDPAQVHAEATRGVATPASSLPHRDAIQRSFGRHDISAIQAHLGDDASASARDMGAQAYATGHHIVFGASPDLHTAAHEAAHVVQQRGGVQLKGGVGEHGDPHERHADAVADLVVRGASSEALLDQYAAGPAATGTGAVQKQDGPRGLPNRKYDCFLNAVLQILAGPYHALFAPTNPVAPEHVGVRNAVYAVLQKVRGGEVDVTKEEIGALRKTLRAAKIVNSEGEQEDAAELMRRILQVVLPAGDSVGIRRTRTLDKAQAEVAPEHQSRDPERYADGVATRDYAANTIPVDIQRYHDLHGFLYEQFGAGGGVTTEFSKDNHPKVQNNGKQVTVSKVTERLGFTRLPGVLTFELHRFRIGATGTKERIYKRFDMPKQLFLIKESDPGGYAQYELAGVVVQQGSLSSGHYYSHVHGGKDWYKANDAEVTKNHVDEDINDGYLYTYVRTAEHAKLPKGATALQDTKPEHAPIDVDDDLARFLSDSDAHDGAGADGTPSTELQGLPNQNAVDCFLNSVLHVLATTVRPERFDPRVATPDERLLASAPSSKSSKQHARPARQPTGKATFYATIKALRPVLAKIVAPKGDQITQKEVDQVRKVLHDHGLVEGVTGQEDAADLMRHLLNIILPASEDAQLGTERTIRRQDTRQIKRGELGTNPQVYHDGKATMPTTESTQFIAVEIEKYTSLESFLYHRFGAGEVINYDGDNRPKVQADDHAVQVSAATERRIFRALPPTLTFVLHRFKQNDDGSRQRINARFAMPTDMVLVQEPARGAKSYVEYALQAMVVQQGSLSSGHYWAYSKAKGDKWTKANDAKVTESDAIGDDLNKGYIYTYQQVRTSPTAPKDKPVAQEDRDRFADGDLGKRLHLLMEQRKFGEAKALLEFPGINVNTLAEGHSPLMRAVAAGQVDLVEALLRHGANPSHPDGYNALRIAQDQSLEDTRIGRLLFAYSMSNVTGYRARLQALQTAKTLDKTAAIALMDDIDSALRAVETQIAIIRFPAPDLTGTLGALAHNLTALRALKSEVNAELAKRLGMTRAGAGNRADANKSAAQGLPKDATVKEQQLFAQLTSGNVHQNNKKTVQEALTAVYATRTYPELIGKIGLWKGKHDVEFDIAGQPWDQKTVYYAQKPFDGNLHKTYNKLDKPEHTPRSDSASAKPESAKPESAKPESAKPEPAKPESVKPEPASAKPESAPPKGSSKDGGEKPPRVGLLFDTTYVEDHNYEDLWGRLLHGVLRDEFDPRHLKETRASDPDALVSSIIIDERDTSNKTREDWEKAALDMQKLATGGSGNRVMRKIAASALPSHIAKALLAAVKGELAPFMQHRNDRGYLPSGVVYWEYPVAGHNKTKLVISHDRKRIYVTVTHYDPYSIRKVSGATENHHAFFDITPDGEVAKALAPSEPTAPAKTDEVTPPSKTPAKTGEVTPPSKTPAKTGEVTPPSKTPAKTGEVTPPSKTPAKTVHEPV